MKFKCEICGRINVVEWNDILSDILVPESQIRDIVENRGGKLKLWCKQCDTVTYHTVVGDE